jgi:hypothetical protein
VRESVMFPLQNRISECDGEGRNGIARARWLRARSLLLALLVLLALLLPMLQFLCAHGNSEGWGRATEVGGYWGRKKRVAGCRVHQSGKQGWAG